MPGATPVSNSSSYDDYGVCYAGDGADLTDYGDTTQTSKPSAVGNCADGVDHDGDASCPTYASGKDAKRAADPDDYGSCEMSDADVAKLHKDQCAADAKAARDRCYDAHASKGRPADSWGQMCEEGARDMQASCENGVEYAPDPDYDPLHTDSETQAEIGCSLEADDAKADFTRRKEMADQRVCERRATEHDGSVNVQKYEDCKNERRNGNDTVSVQNNENQQDSSKNGWKKDEGGHHNTSVDVGWKAPLGWNAGVKHEQGRSWNDSKYGENGRVEGRGQTVTKSYDRTDGWQKQADQLEKDTYGQCMEREGQ